MKKIQIKKVDLKKESADLIRELNEVKKFRIGRSKSPRVAKTLMEWCGNTHAEIENYLDFVVYPATQLLGLDQAVDLLGERLKKHGRPTEPEKLRKKILKKLSPVDKARENIRLSLIQELEWQERGKGSAAEKEEKNNKKENTRHLKRESLSVLFGAICHHLESEGIQVDFNGIEFFPKLSEDKGKRVDHLWISTAYLYQDIRQAPERLKRCFRCGLFFWDMTNNLSKEICDDSDCVNERGYELLKRHRQIKKLKSLTKDVFDYLRHIPDPIPAGEIARQVNARVNDLFSKLHKAFKELSEINFEDTRKKVTSAENLKNKQKMIKGLVAFQNQIHAAIKTRN